jgi:hypothetical protein
MGVIRNIRHIAAVTVCVAAMSLGLATASQASTAGLQATGRPAALALPGGLRAVPVKGSRAAADSPSLPAGWVNEGGFALANETNQGYVITDQPTNSDGRSANHLYMWADNGWSTQIFDDEYNSSTNMNVFVSQYDGADGGVAYGCINFPGATPDQGIQLIVYSCGVTGQYSNEEFKANYACSNNSCQAYSVAYNSDLAIAIGSNFPGNGAWVITYDLNLSNPNEIWTCLSEVGVCG